MNKAKGKNLFNPPHCPNPECSNYHPKDNHEWFVRRGYKVCNSTSGQGKEKVPQFMCKECDRSFSPRTFEPGYYDKKPTDYDQIIKEARSDISQKEWAGLCGLSAPTLGRRLFKVVGILVRECEGSARGRSFVTRRLLEECRRGLCGKRADYVLLRDLVVRLRRVLTEMQNLRRCFLSRLPKLFTDFLNLLGSWSYEINEDYTYTPYYSLRC